MPWPLYGSTSLKMDKIQVTARFTKEGRIIPTKFVFHDTIITVQDWGRQWEDKEGRHILVMDARKKTYHLLFNVEEFTWYLVQDISSPAVPS